ncbi:MAG: hypothetical protein M0Z90_03800 [Desulfobacteraceae bacterium]|nr:hypothetical protein [Desulfobacteraceae bacterium]
MALLGAGASASGLVMLQRLARLYEGECWWLSGPGGEPRGLLCLDGGSDLWPLRDAVMETIRQGHGVNLRRAPALASAGRPAAESVSSRPGDCQVTVEERSQLFGLLKRGR